MTDRLPPGEGRPDAGSPARPAGIGGHLDPDWEALRETVWEPGQTPGSYWAQARTAWMDSPGAATGPSKTLPPNPTTPVPAPLARRKPTTARPTAAHKVVPRPKAAHRGQPARGPRPSRLPYRTGTVRRVRSTCGLVVLSAVLACLFAAIAIAVIAGIAVAISGAASS